MARGDFSVGDELRTAWFRLVQWVELRRESDAELLATRERLVEAYAYHAGIPSGPALMGIAASLRDVERELRRRGFDVDEDDRMRHRPRQQD